MVHVHVAQNRYHHTAHVVLLATIQERMDIPVMNVTTLSVFSVSTPWVLNVTQYMFQTIILSLLYFLIKKPLMQFIDTKKKYIMYQEIKKDKVNGKPESVVGSTTLLFFLS